MQVLFFLLCHVFFNSSILESSEDKIEEQQVVNFNSFLYYNKENHHEEWVKVRTPFPSKIAIYSLAGERYAPVLISPQTKEQVENGGKYEEGDFFVACQADYNKMQAELPLLKQENACLLQVSSELRQKGDDLLKENEKLGAANTNLKKVNTGLLQVNDEVREANEVLRQVNDEVREANEVLRQVNDEVREANEVLRQVNDEVREANEVLRQVNGEVRKANEESLVDNTRLRVDNASLLSDNTDLKERNQNLQKSNKKISSALILVGATIGALVGDKVFVKWIQPEVEKYFNKKVKTTFFGIGIENEEAVRYQVDASRVVWDVVCTSIGIAIPAVVLKLCSK